MQRGEEPDDWKPMPSVGNGCREIRVRTSDGAFRSIYVLAGTPAGLYVLAVFTKKTQTTPKRIIELARRRYKAAIDHAKGGAGEH